MALVFRVIVDLSMGINYFRFSSESIRGIDNRSFSTSDEIPLMKSGGEMSCVLFNSVKNAHSLIFSMPIAPF